MRTLLLKSLTLMFTCLVPIAFVPTSHTQKKTPEASWTYDIVSIKLENPNATSVGFRKTPRGFEAYTVSLKDLIAEAYGLMDQSLISGEPKWSTHFHIVAKLDDDKAGKFAALSTDDQSQQRRAMLQALLAGYFHLSVHRHQRGLSVYSLVVSKDEAQAKDRVRCDSQAQRDDGSDKSVQSFFGNGRIVGCFSMEKLVHLIYISRVAHMDTSDKPIVNNTGMKGEFRVDLAWSVLSGSLEANKQSDAEVYGSFESAMKNKLGLRLIPETIQTDGVVVDHVEQPTLD